MSCCCCNAVDAPEESCAPLTASQIDSLQFLYGKNEDNCPRWMNVEDILPTACSIGALATPGTLTSVLGLSNNNCLIFESPTVFVRRNETDWDGSSPLGTVVIGNDGATATNGHTPTFDVVIAPAQMGIPNQTVIVPGQGIYTPLGAGIVPTDTASIDMSFNPATGALSATVELSSCAGNLLNVRGDGLCVQETQITVVDSESVNLQSSGVDNHTIQAFVKLSSCAGNRLTTQTDGLCVQETPLTTIDTPTLLLSTSGVSDHILQGSVRISACAGNRLAVQADGLCVQETPNVPLTVVDTATIDLTSSGVDGHTLQADVKLSTTGGNQIQISGGGLYVAPFVETPFVANDSASIDFTTSGVNNHTLTGTVKVSAAAGNQIVTNVDGIFVAANVETPLVANDSPTINFTSSGTAGHTLTAAVNISNCPGNILRAGVDGLCVVETSETPITGTDTASVNLTVGGVNAHTVQADVKISATAGNQIAVNADGLFVAATPVAAQTPLVANDSASINFTTSGTDNHTLTGVVKVSATVGNLITTNGDGIYVAETPFVANDSSSINFTTSGTVNHTLTGVVKVSAAAGNAITVMGDGIFALAENPLTVVDSSTIDLTASGTGNHTLAAAVKVSADVCNAIQVRGDGLWSELPGFMEYAFFVTPGVSLNNSNLPAPGNFIAVQTLNWSFTNNNCYPMHILGFMREGTNTFFIAPGTEMAYSHNNGAAPGGDVYQFGVGPGNPDWMHLSWGGAYAIWPDYNVPPGQTVVGTVTKWLEVFSLNTALPNDAFCGSFQLRIYGWKSA